MERARPHVAASAQRDIHQRRGLSRRQAREGQHMSTDLVVTADQRLAAAKQMGAFRAALKASGGWPMVTTGKVPEPIKDSQPNVLKAIDVLGLDCRYDLFLSSYVVQ